MTVKFDFNIPMENLIDRNAGTIVHIEADVMNPGLPSELVQIRNVSGPGMAILWNMQGSSEMYVTVCRIASEHASDELKRIDDQVMAIYKQDHIVTIAEEVLL